MKKIIGRCPVCRKTPVIREIGGPVTCSSKCDRELRSRPIRRADALTRHKARREMERRREVMRREARAAERSLNRKGGSTGGYRPGFLQRQRMHFVKTYGASFYTSREWLAVRHRALTASNGRCELCGAGKPEGARLHVDHIKPRSRHPELELDPSNLQVLCGDCNRGKGRSDDRDWRRDGDATTASAVAAYIANKEGTIQ